MTEEEKLIALKAMVGGSDSDEVLSTYLCSNFCVGFRFFGFRNSNTLLGITN
mgnify:CR=1 FL=1